MSEVIREDKDLQERNSILMKYHLVNTLKAIQRYRENGGFPIGTDCCIEIPQFVECGPLPVEHLNLKQVIENAIEAVDKMERA